MEGGGKHHQGIDNLLVRTEKLPVLHERLAQKQFVFPESLAEVCEKYKTSLEYKVVIDATPWGRER